jgi:raffinose synthase
VYSALAKAAPSPRQQFVLIRWAQKAAGALAGIATAAFLLFYQWVIEPAAPNSLRVRAFAALTNVSLGV